MSTIVTSFYMEDFEIKAVRSAEHPPRTWKRYVNEIFMVKRTSEKFP